MKTESGKKQTLRKLRKRCSGQAIPELAVCLVALLIVLLGYLLLSSLTLENVDNVIKAREKADRNARRGGKISASEARNIVSWDYGEKGIAFTGNDKPRSRQDASGLNFIRELSTVPEPPGSARSFDLTAATPNSYGYLPVDHNATVNLSLLNLFLNAANLSAGKASENNPLEKRGCGSLREAFQNLFGIRSFRLKDTVFLPAQPSIARPENIP